LQLNTVFLVLTRSDSYREEHRVKQKAGTYAVFAAELDFPLIFLVPVGRNITGVRRELHDVGIIQPFTLQPFALSVVLYTKPA